MTAPGPVFLDTVGLIALANSDDGLHRIAVEVQAQLAADRARLVTTDWILAELLGRGARRPLRRAVIATIESLLASKVTSIVPASRDGWRRAFDLYRARPDKDWSLVDCSSILACQHRGIRRVFTNDRHFAQAGLETLLV